MAGLHFGSRGGGGLSANISLGGGTALARSSVISHFRSDQPLPALDDFSRASAGWALDGSNVVQEYASDVIRVGPAGAWVEGARTNYIYNNVLAGAAAPNTPPTGWSAPAASDLTVEASIFYSGDALGQVAADSRPYIRTPSIVWPAGDYAISYFVEALSFNTWNTAFEVGFLVGPAAVAELAPYRVSGVVTQESEVTGRVRFGLGVAGNETGTATLSLLQVEAGAFPSTPILVAATDAPFTRSAEQWLTGLAEDMTTLTVFVEATAAPGLSGNQVLFQADDGSEDDRLTIRRNSSGNLIVETFVDGVAEASIDLGAVANSASIRVTAYVEAGSLRARLGDGGTVVEDTGGAMPTLTAGRTGHNSATASHWFGTVSERIVARVAPVSF